MKPYLKWAGGKYKLISTIKEHLPTGKRFIEPFVGSGAVFINLDYPENVLCDTNEDLINLHNYVKNNGQHFIDQARLYFVPENNDEIVYYKLREKFNQSKDTLERSYLFLYLNRHCYNGLCRYNSAGGFNVPFGRYKTIYFPEAELKNFHEKSKNTTFILSSFENTIKMAKSGDVIYCDPPYVPLGDNNFTYTGNEFGLKEQQLLVQSIEEAKNRGVYILISNHDCKITRKLYNNASNIIELDVQRNISCSERTKAKELIAIYE